MKKLIALCAAISLSACVSMSAAPAGNYKVKNGTQVTLKEAWTHIPSALNGTKGSVLTKDGIGLNRVYIATVSDGKRYIDGGKSAEYPIYTMRSSPLEQIDFVTSNLQRMGVQDLVPQNIEPARVGGLDGTQMDLTGQYSSGLDMKGKAVLAESGAGLNFLVYMAPTKYYYEKDAAEVDSMIRSLRFPAK